MPGKGTLVIRLWMVAVDLRRRRCAYEIQRGTEEGGLHRGQETCPPAQLGTDLVPLGEPCGLSALR